MPGVVSLSFFNGNSGKRIHLFIGCVLTRDRNPVPCIGRQVFIYLFQKIFIFLIGGKWLYKFTLVSVLQEWESVVIIYIHSSLLNLFPLPLSYPFRSSQSAGLAPYVTEQLPTNYFTRGGVYMSMPLSQFVPPSSSPAVSTNLFSTSFISTVFLDSIYMC